LSGAASRARVRPLTDYDDLKRCVEFQRVIWGADFTELAPASLLWVAVRTGGILAAAVDARDDMLGFIFGITGYRDGRPIHWSDMLGVREDVRGQGVGRLLKVYQRDTLLAAGVTHVAWTFDPLQSRNAWLNFARLGITAGEYIADCYGVSASPLHAGLGTDRLVATWHLDSDRVRSRIEGRRAPLPPAGARRLNPDPAAPELGLDEPSLLLRIPADIQRLRAADPGAAARWRSWTRPVFEAYIARGYEVRELYREDADWSSYLLARS
jgi:predicted GNAT superfamily acetyltransferase